MRELKLNPTKVIKELKTTASVWTRRLHKAYRFGQSIQSGRVRIKGYHIYPTHSAFDGSKQSGAERKNYLMTLNHYQQTKNVRFSCSLKIIGFF